MCAAMASTALCVAVCSAIRLSAAPFFCSGARSLDMSRRTRHTSTATTPRVIWDRAGIVGGAATAWCRRVRRQR